MPARPTASGSARYQVSSVMIPADVARATSRGSYFDSTFDGTTNDLTPAAAVPSGTRSSA